MEFTIKELLNMNTHFLHSDAELGAFIFENNIRNFKPSEFVCPHCKQLKIDPRIVKIIQYIRDKYNKPITVTSAYRCPEYNSQIGGVPNSAHVRGYALDISCTTSQDRYRLLNILLNMGLPRIGIASNFIHIDIDPDKYEKTGNVIWTYGKKQHIA